MAPFYSATVFRKSKVPGRARLNERTGFVPLRDLVDPFPWELAAP